MSAAADSKGDVVLSFPASAPGVGVITMRRGENKFNAGLVDELHRCIDEFEKSAGRALVFSGETGSKFYSTGLDLQWFVEIGGGPAVDFIINRVWRVLGRILTLGVPTVAAVNGHAYGAGFFLALCCDYRVQHASKGFLCFPEVSLGMRLSDGFNVIAQTKLTRNALRDGVLTGKRWAAADALAAGVIDRSSPDPIADAIALAGSMTGIQSDRAVVSTLKEEMYWDCVKVLRSQTDLTLIAPDSAVKLNFGAKPKANKPKSKL